MTLLYRVGDDITIEMSSDALRWVEGAIDEMLNGIVTSEVEREARGFANAIRAHLQHIETQNDNSDLI